MHGQASCATVFCMILSKLADAAATASPGPGNEPARPPNLDQKLVDEYNEWRKEYDQWLKGAAKTYTAQRIEYQNSD